MMNYLKNLIKRAKLTLNGVDNSNAQLTYMSNSAPAELISPYGLTAVAPVGTLTLMINVLAQEENHAGIAYKPPGVFVGLKIGEVQIGNTLTQASIKFNEDGSIVINTTGNVIVNANTVVVNANTTTVNGTVELGGAGGVGVARIGDSVDLTTGLITSGSSTVTAV